MLGLSSEAASGISASERPDPAPPGALSPPGPPGASARWGGRVTDSQQRPQRTLRSAVTIDGTGLHTGQPVKATLNPAEPGTGLMFRR
ncbi:MAG: UDP-3-O-acyl-N-acetylglucosamine deacetylase, partial [Gemmatimonadetes bacterium]|nr:UDP-3-O-acyl-N-acetylglucosamine deacetylase [Gemmatimonadota bacterium]